MMEHVTKLPPGFPNEKNPPQDMPIIRDDLIKLIGQKFRQTRRWLRRIVDRVELDGQNIEMVFLSNQMSGGVWTVAELYRCRWGIEVFFKEIKQTLQLSDFLGHSANSIRWQMWRGLLVRLLLRYQAFLHGWSHSFTRLFTVIRAVLWRRWSLPTLLDSYGTAKPPGRLRGNPEQAYLPGFA